MAALDLQEQEQVEALKAWWKENGKWVVLAVVLAVAIFGGMRGWKSYQTHQNDQAAALYGDVLKQLSSNDAKRVGDAAKALVDRYGSTAYAARAQLLAAQVSIQAQSAAQAKEQLQWVIDHATEAGLQHAARLKYASLLLDEKTYDAALKMLESVPDDAFSGLYIDLKGDVLNAQGKKSEARLAYQAALEKVDSKSAYRNLIQMKLDGLGEAK